jgi:hypothetical protein
LVYVTPFMLKCGACTWVWRWLGESVFRGSLWKMTKQF